MWAESGGVIIQHGGGGGRGGAFGGFAAREGEGRGYAADMQPRLAAPLPALAPIVTFGRAARGPRQAAIRVFVRGDRKLAQCSSSEPVCGERGAARFIARKS